MNKLLAALITATLATGTAYAADPAKKDAKPAAAAASAAKKEAKPAAPAAKKDEKPAAKKEEPKK